jgi:transposase
MHHVAVDLGSKQSQFCIRSSDGTILQENRIATRSLPEFFGRLEPSSRIILETCAEAFAVADAARAQGHDVRVVPSSLAPSLGVGLHGVKTDRRDAQNLSMTSCRVELRGVHIPSVPVREWRAMLRQRETLVQSRTELINSVRGWARQQVVKIPGGKSATFPARARKKFLESPCGVPEYIERTLKQIESANELVKEADAEVRKLVTFDETCGRLMTVPGVGPVTALRFRAAIDEVKRFPSAAAVGSYLGLTPGEDSSSDRVRRTGLTKAGPSAVRRTLGQAAWTAMRTATDTPMVKWATAIAARRGRKIAVMALARKMSGVLFAIWRDGTVLEESRM